MKRSGWVAGAAVLLVAGAVVWLWPSATDITIITAIHADNGTVEWVEAELRPAEENHPYVHELSRTPPVSKLADDVEIHTAFGCGDTPRGLDLSWNGLGAAPCSRQEFLALEHPPYAPRLTFNLRGEISEIVGRYHP